MCSSRALSKFCNGVLSCSKRSAISSIFCRLPDSTPRGSFPATAANCFSRLLITIFRSELFWFCALAGYDTATTITKKSRTREFIIHLTCMCILKLKIKDRCLRVPPIVKCQRQPWCGSLESVDESQRGFRHVVCRIRSKRLVHETGRGEH